MSNSGRLKWNHSFNSTLVQLKELSRCPTLSNLISFNSTLVQLKESVKVSNTNILVRFQFYLSSIKRHV